MDLVDRVAAALQRSVLPAVVARGGAVRVVAVEDGVATLEVRGSPGRGAAAGRPQPGPAGRRRARDGRPGRRHRPRGGHQAVLLRRETMTTMTASLDIPAASTAWRR